jgi:hypothetical protein
MRHGSGKPKQAVMPWRQGNSTARRVIAPVPVAGSG